MLCTCVYKYYCFFPRDYVQRAFASVSNEMEKDRVEAVLKEKIEKAFNEGAAMLKDWSKEPLPLYVLVVCVCVCVCACMYVYLFDSSYPVEFRMSMLVTYMEVILKIMLEVTVFNVFLRDIFVQVKTKCMIIISVKLYYTCILGSVTYTYFQGVDFSL